MNKPYILLACLLLLGSLSAQTWLLGSLEGSNGRWHKVYMSDGLLPAKIGANHFVLACGTYRPMHDGSPGYITLVRQDWQRMASVLAHEMCHARQNDEGRAQDEAECERWS